MFLRSKSVDPVVVVLQTPRRRPTLIARAGEEPVPRSFDCWARMEYAWFAPVRRLDDHALSGASGEITPFTGYTRAIDLERTDDGWTVSNYRLTASSR